MMWDDEKQLYKPYMPPRERKPYYLRGEKKRHQSLLVNSNLNAPSHAHLSQTVVNETPGLGNQTQFIGGPLANGLAAVHGLNNQVAYSTPNYNDLNVTNNYTTSSGGGGPPGEDGDHTPGDDPNSEEGESPQGHNLSNEWRSITKSLNAIERNTNKAKGIQCRVNAPNKFNGTSIEDFYRFKKEFIEYAAITNKTGPEACRICYTYLKDSAANWFEDLNEYY